MLVTPILPSRSFFKQRNNFSRKGQKTVGAAQIEHIFAWSESNGEIQDRLLFFASVVLRVLTIVCK